MSLFWKLEGQVGLLEVISCFQRAIDSENVEVEHDDLRCKDCWVNGDIVYCEQSRYHSNHLYHKCPA